MADLAPGTGYVETTAGLRGLGKDFAGYVRGELGARLSVNASVFAFGEATFAQAAAPGWQAGVGARLTW